MVITPCLPVTSADNFGKQFGPWSGLTNRPAWSGSKLFDILMVFLKEFFQKVNFEKISRRQKKHKKFPSMQWVNDFEEKRNGYKPLTYRSSSVICPVRGMMFREISGLCKQCRPRSDCSQRSSLIRVFTVCYTICILWTWFGLFVWILGRLQQRFLTSQIFMNFRVILCHLVPRL